MTNRAAINEPKPIKGKVNIGELVLKDVVIMAETNDDNYIGELITRDIQARIDLGKQKYGTVLQSHNGRDALMDSYQESIDLCMYLKQVSVEGKIELGTLYIDALKVSFNIRKLIKAGT